MLSTKTRDQGKSVVVTLPQAHGHKIPSNKEYIVIYGEDDTITLVPKIDNPFLVAETGAFYESDEWQDVSEAGRELL